MNGSILALSDPQPIVEWSSRYKGHHPQFETPGEESTWVPRVDAYARRVTNRWMYVLLETHGAGDFLVAFEVLIDADGNAFFCRRDDSVTPASAIPERGEPLLFEGASGPSVSLMMTDEKGRALDVRLLLSPFRLPSTAIARLDDPSMRKEIRKRIAPLWEWKPGKDDESPLQSSDLWMKLEGEDMRVWAGADPFAIAVHRSEVYVAARDAYLKVYEPKVEWRQKELAKVRLAQAIDATILRPDAVRERYGAYVDTARLNEALEKDDQRRRRMIKRFETAGAALCQVLDSPLFRLFQEASLSEEGIEHDQRSEPLSEHLRVLGLSSRMLGQCKSGQALLTSWAEEAQKNPHHFINKVILPAKPPAPSWFKAFRWGSKALATFLAEFLGHKSRVLRIGAKKAVTEELACLSRLGIGNAFDPVTQVLDIRRLEERVRMGGLDLDVFEVDIKVPKRPKPHTHRFYYAGPDMEPIITDWVQAGAIINEGPNKYLLDAKVAGALLLDMFNFAFALKAVIEAEGGERRLRAMLDSGAAGVGLVATLAEEGAKRGWLGLGPYGRAGVERGARVVKGVVSVYYGFTNAFDAKEAFRKGDTDRGFALSVAAAGEFAAIVGEIWALYAPASLVAPWLMVGAGVVAAAAYIAAEELKDDPLEMFLEQCEWGRAPYTDPLLEPSWADTKVSKWPGDYAGQGRTLTRVLLRLTATWKFEQWPAITVSWGAHMPGARLEVEFVATDSKARQAKKTVVVEGADLPQNAPFEVVADPAPGIKVYGYEFLVAKVRFRPGPGTYEESLDCFLMASGYGVKQGTVTRVS